MKHYSIILLFIFASLNVYAGNQADVLHFPKQKQNASKAEINKNLPTPKLRREHKVAYESFLNSIKLKKVDCEVLDSFTQKDYVYLKKNENRNQKSNLSEMDFYDSKIFPHKKDCFYSAVIRLLPCADGIGAEVFTEILAKLFAEDPSRYFSLLNKEYKNHKRENDKIDSWSCSTKEDFLDSYSEKSNSIEDALVNLETDDLKTFIRKAKTFKFMHPFGKSIKNYIDKTIDLAEQFLKSSEKNE